MVTSSLNDVRATVHAAGNGMDSNDSSDTLDEQQKNSVNMLNYLAMFTEEISASGDSRVFVEEAYSNLINNTFPKAVDEKTQEQIENLLNTLFSYRMIDEKRDRLQYLYEQDQSKALRASMPNPLGLLSTISSFDLKRIVISGAYMFIDAYAKSKSYKAEIDAKYMQENWTLDDEEAANIHNLRTDMFSYMLDVVRDYNLPGDIALNETAINNFVTWQNETNITRKIQWFESNQETYKVFGPYWLALADSYYNNGDYSKCLNAIEMYEKIQTRIFREDYSFANVLPYAIIACGEIYTGEIYVTKAEHLLSLLVALHQHLWVTEMMNEQ